MNKSFGLKVLGNGRSPTEEQMQKINRFALVELKPEQVYVRRYLMAHNGIDRDNERFSDSVLDEFASSLPGKGFFVEGHPGGWSGKGAPGEGLFFDAATQKMTPERFEEITGEAVRLPEGVAKVKVLWGDAYLLRLDSNQDTLAKIDAGIYKFTSIGFRATLRDVAGKNGNRLYGEYHTNGEALEGSLVWLGAQPGASAMKARDRDDSRVPGSEPPRSDQSPITHHSSQTEGGKDMDELLKSLSTKLGKTLTPEGAADEIHGIIAAKDAEIEARTTEIQALTADRDGLKALVEDGKVYRKTLLDDAVRFGALLGEVPTDEVGQKKQADFMATWPVEQIKAIRDRYEKRARESFPDTFTIKAKDDADRRKFTDPASEMEARVQEKMAAAKMGYSEAFAAVQREHPDLARRYAESIRK